MVYKTRLSFLLFFCVSIFQLNAQIFRITPDLKVTYGSDARFTETLTTSEFFVDQPFYMHIEASATPSFMSNLVQDSVWCHLFFIHGDSPLIEISLVEATTAYEQPTNEELRELASELTRIDRNDPLERFINEIDREYTNYNFPVSWKPRGHITRLIFRIVPSQRGTQEIRFLFNDSHIPYARRSQIYKFTILPKK